MTVLGVGVIGLGVGERHLASYRRIPECDVVALCDIDEQRLAEVGKRFDIPARYTDYRKITEHPDIDVVSICSYDDVHAEQAISALENGKHVMVEKPIALFRADAEKLLRAHQDSGRRMSSNLILRASPRFLELKAQIAHGEFGEVSVIEGDYVHNILWKITEGWRGQMAFYSVIYGGGIHLIDLMRWLIGQEVESVCGMAGDMLTRKTTYRGDDSVLNLFRFDGGAIGKTLTTYGPQRTKFHALNVYGSKKTFINDLPNGKLFDGTEPENEHQVLTPYPGMAKGDLLPDFISAIVGGREPGVSARDVFRVMDICFAASESARQGRTVAVSYLT
jgi:predicted dehydrogenase